MNERFLFKGKRIDDKGWIVGNLLDHGNPLHPEIVKNYKSYKIYRETVCQSTGLTDDNGKMLFENDRCNLVAQSEDGEKINTNGIVKWDFEDAGFYLETIYDKWPHIKFWFIKSIVNVENVHDMEEMS